MIKKTKPAAVGMAIVAALLLAACTPAAPDRDLDMAESPSTSSSPVATDAPGAPGTGGSPVPIDVEWRSVLRREAPASDFEVLLYAKESSVSQEVVAGNVTLTYTAADGVASTLKRGRQKYVQQVWLWGDEILLLGSAEAWWDPPYQLELWTPGESTTRSLTTARGLDSLVEADLAGDNLYYIVEGLQGACLYRASFPSDGGDLAGNWITCSRRDETGLWWLLTSGPDVSWIASSKSRIAPTNGEFTCSTLFRLVSGAEIPEVVPGAECVSRGAASGEVAAWSDAPAVDPETNASSWDEAQMHAAASSGSVADVGSGSAGSEMTCAGLVLWKTVVVGAGGENLGDQHRAWTPERGVMSLSAPPGSVAADDALGRLRCIDNTMIGFQRFNVVTRVVDYFVADLSRINVD